MIDFKRVYSRLLILFCILFFIPVIVFAQESENLSETNSEIHTEPIYSVFSGYSKAKILEIHELTETLENNIEDSEGFKVISIQKIEVEILNGDFKGNSYTFENNVTNNPLNVKVREGDKVILHIAEYNDGEIDLTIHDFYRLDLYIFMIIISIIILIFFSSIKSIKIVGNIAIIALILLYYFIPQILMGNSPLFVAFVSSVIIAFSTTVLIAGLSKKTWAALIGSVIGLIIGLIFAILFQKFAYITGITFDELKVLVNKYQEINLSDLFIGVFIIGMIGFIIDLSMRASLKTYELIEHYPNITFVDLVALVINKQRLILISKISNVFLVYLSIFLPLFIVYKLHIDSEILLFLNSELIGDFLVRSLGIMIGLLMCIPATAIVAAMLALGNSKSTKDKNFQKKFDFK